MILIFFAIIFKIKLMKSFNQILKKYQRFDFV
jgi:hypothetical protein